MTNNNLYCGDSLALMSKMDKNSVDLVLTDIPYNEVNRKTGDIRLNGRQIRYDYGIADDAQINLPAILDQMWRVCKGSFYIFCGLGQISPINDFFRSKGCTTRLIVYEKTNPMPINAKFTWLSGIETAVFAKKSGATFNFDCRNTVLRYPIAQPTGHPTPKPLNLMRELILASSNENDVVLDPFMGGGTVPLAAMMEKRQYIGIDIEKTYYEIAVKRLDNYSKQLTLL